MKKMFYDDLLELSKLMEVLRTILWKFMTPMTIVTEVMIYLFTDMILFPTICVVILTLIVGYVSSNMIHNGSVIINEWVKNQLTPKDE